MLERFQGILPPRLQTPDSMAAPNSYGNGVVPCHPMMMANSTGIRLPVTSMISSPLEASGAIYTADVGQGMRHGNMLSLVEPLKKKRGRPRKYGPDGTMALNLTNSSGSDRSIVLSSEPTAKRLGRPPGSRKKQQINALGSFGTSFTPHVIIVKAGEDVVSQIKAFSQQGPRTVCIISANGAVSNVALQQSSGGSVTYEDRFELISLSGSLHKDKDSTCLKAGYLSVTLAGFNGHVIAGEVGRLMAAGPVQVVLGSFMLSEKKQPKKGPSKPKPSKPDPKTPVPLKLDLPKPDPSKREEPSSAPAQLLGFRDHSLMSPPSRGSMSESDDEQRSHANNHNISGYHMQGGHNPVFESFN